MEKLEHVVVIDDSKKRSSSVAGALNAFGLDVTVNPSLKDIAWSELGRCAVAALINSATIDRIVKNLATQRDWVPVVVFGDPDDRIAVLDALRAGAHDFVPWPSDPTLLERRLRSSSENEKRCKRQRRSKMEFGERLEVLTRREQEVLGWVGEGQSSKLIAERMSISPRTVDIHRANMMRKIGAKSPAHAVKIMTQRDDHWATFFRT